MTAPTLETVIRSAKINDAESINKINFAAFGYDYGVEETAKSLSAILGKAHLRIFVAEYDERVVGYIHGSDYSYTFSPPMKNLLTMAVLEEYRRLGIGLLLMTELEAWAREDGCAGIRLVSGYNRPEAHEFYHHCGFFDRKDQKNFVKLF